MVSLKAYHPKFFLLVTGYLLVPSQFEGGLTMKTVTCKRRFQLCAGHRVHLHESKCRNLHGHNYIIFATASAPKLDSVGRVIDFGDIKARLGNWLEENWDHGMILFSEDPIVELWDRLMERRREDGAFQKHYLMPTNPTAENMALHLLHDVCPLLFDKTDITITEIEVQETENCSAKASL